MKKTLKIVGFCVVVLVLIIILVAGNKPDANGPVKIGVFTPLTGDASIYGLSLKKGIDLAVEKQNESGILGRQIELIYEDTHLDPKTAVSAFNKLVNIDKVDFVIAADGSSATSAVAPMIDQAKKVTIIPIASADSLKNAGDYVFRVIPSDGYRGKEMGKYAMESGYKKAAILYVNDAYGVGIMEIFAESFEGVGGNIVAKEAFTAGDTDFRGQLTKIKESKPDVIIVAAIKEFPIIMKQKSDLGLSGKVMFSEVIYPSVIASVNVVMDGVETLDFAPVTDYVGFKDIFKNKYNEDAPLYADYGYDSIGILIGAIEKVKTVDNKKVKEALYLTEYKGATGLTKFDSFGEVMEKILIPMIVKDGKFIPTPTSK